jgi:helix-turn-helix, Psq domain
VQICAECKDKVVRFYHFKRKIQSENKQIKCTTKIPKKHKQRSKIVHDIVDIIDNYSQKCAVSSVKVDEKNNKLIIVAADHDQEYMQTEFNMNYDEEPAEETSIIKISIKEEPDDDSMVYGHSIKFVDPMMLANTKFEGNEKEEEENYENECDDALEYEQLYSLNGQSRRKKLYPKEAKEMAIQKVREGQRISLASRLYNVPYSTLRDFFKKPKMEEKSKKFKKIRMRQNEPTMKAAVDDVMKGMKIVNAAKKYNIPNSSLWDAVNKRKKSLEGAQNVAKNFKIIPIFPEKQPKIVSVRSEATAKSKKKKTEH